MSTALVTTHEPKQLSVEKEASGLARIEKASRLLAEAKTIDDAIHVVNIAAVAEIWGRRAKLSVEVVNHAAELRLDAERKAGGFAEQLDRSKGGAGTHKKNNSSNTGRVSSYSEMLKTLGVSRQDVDRWRKLNAIPEKEYIGRKEAIKKDLARITTSGVLAVTAGVGFDGNEWATPPHLIERARRVLGGVIELDPAPTAKANATVKAKAFFTKMQDGLSRDWQAETLFLNPPYSAPLCQKFIEKLVHHRAAGEVKRAILLVNAQTDPAWFHLLVEAGALVCFTRGRIGFVNPETGEASDGNRVGQAIFFFGCDYRQVVAEFADVGTVMARVKA